MSVPFPNGEILMTTREPSKLVFIHHKEKSSAFGDTYWHQIIEVNRVGISRYSQRARYLRSTDSPSDFERFGRNLTQLTNEAGDDRYVNWMRMTDCVKFKWQAGGNADYSQYHWYAMQVSMDCDSGEWETLDSIRRIMRKNGVHLHKTLHPQHFVKALMLGGALPLKRIDFEKYDHEYIIDRGFNAEESFPLPEPVEADVPVVTTVE